MAHELKPWQERNIILSQAFEYREPSSKVVSSAAQAFGSAGSAEKLKLNMTSRFLGLIVVPGQYITKIEVEEQENTHGDLVSGV